MYHIVWFYFILITSYAKRTVGGVQADAEAWATGLTCDDTCYVDVVKATKSMREVLVTAASEAYTSACAGASTECLRIVTANLLSQ